MSDKDEIRTDQQCQIRAAGDAGEMRISGYAAVFNSLSEDLGGFREMIRPGAFRGTIGGDDIRALWQHDPAVILGRSTNGTLRLEEDDHGLAFDMILPDTQTARDIYKSVERGDVDQMSFGFRTIRDAWNNDHEAGQTLRELLEVKLSDVSLVTYPAYPATSAEARAMVESLQAPDPDPAIDGNDPAGEDAGQDAENTEAPGGALRLMRLRLAEID